MKAWLIAGAGALTLAATAAFAQETMTAPALDANADGTLDRGEFDAYVAGSFATMDANGDGYVTEAESATFMPADLYAATNTNGDDGVSLQEFQTRAEADFAAADKDGDGMLD